MTNDDKNENLRFSRSGRVLKKTLKMKEMEEIELEENKKENIFRQFSTSSFKIKTGCAMDNHRVYKVPRSNSSGSSSTSCPSISVDNSFGYKTENRNQEANSDSKNSTYVQIEDDNCSMGACENLSSDLSTQESNGSTHEANYTTSSQKYKPKTNIGRRKCLKKSSKRKIKKCSHSVTRKRVGSNKGKSKQPRIFYSTRRKARKNLKSSKFNPKLLHQPIWSIRKSSSVLPEKGKDNTHDATGHFPVDRFATECDRPSQSVALYFNNDMMEDTEQITEHPLGIGPIDVAAHLKLLGDNLCKIGLAIAQHDVAAPGMYYVLLVSLLCAVGPLLCLTREIAGLEGLNDDVFVKILDHIAYIMPGL